MENTETKKWDISVPEERKELETYFLSQPIFRIMEFCDKFWIQMKYPNQQQTYNRIDDCLYYQNLQEPYFNNGFWDLNDAIDMYNKYRSIPKYHPLPELKIEKPNVTINIENLVDKIEIHTSDMQTEVEDIKKKVTDILTDNNVQ